MTDEEIRAKAIEFAKRNKNHIAKELTDPAKYMPDVVPISVFMAGSPGAGKTEFSKNLIKILEEDKERHVVRIDSDEVRSRVPGYIGTNSYLFQGAVSLIVEKMHDLVLHQNQSFVLDSTFAKYEKAADNIRRSLDKKRPIFVFYIYQKPETAWKFTQAREEVEDRNIPKSAFIERFLGAREVVGKIFDAFNDRVTILFVKKDFERNTPENIYRINRGKEEIDFFIQQEYTKENLEKCL